MDQEQRERLIDQQERAEGKAGLLYGRHIRGAGIIGAEGKTIFHGQVCVAGVRALACRVLFISTHCRVDQQRKDLMFAPIYVH